MQYPGPPSAHTPRSQLHYRTGSVTTTSLIIDSEMYKLICKGLKPISSPVYDVGFFFLAMADVPSVNAFICIHDFNAGTGTSGIHLGVLLRQDEQRKQKTIMSNCSASSIYSQRTRVDTKTLPDSEEFAFIACGDLQYSFPLLGGGCFCFHVCSHWYFHPGFSGYLYPLEPPLLSCLSTHF